jgi:hypothetical protein
MKWKLAGIARIIPATVPRLLQMRDLRKSGVLLSDPRPLDETRYILCAPNPPCISIIPTVTVNCHHPLALEVHIERRNVNGCITPWQMIGFCVVGRGW